MRRCCRIFDECQKPAMVDFVQSFSQYGFGLAYLDYYALRRMFPEMLQGMITVKVITDPIRHEETGRLYSAIPG